MRNKFSGLRWLALFLYFVGLILVFVTKNVKIQPLFNLVAGFLICFDSFVIAPRPTLSLFSASDDAKPRFRLSPLMSIGFVLLFVSVIYFSHIRTSALLAMLGLLLLVFDRNMNANSVTTNR
jgi:hypothetical protein